MLLLVSEEYVLFRPPQHPAPLSPPSGEGQPGGTLWEPSTENLKDTGWKILVFLLYLTLPTQRT